MEKFSVLGLKKLLILVQVLALTLASTNLPLIPKDVVATASYRIDISVDPTSGNVGTSFRVSASVDISGMETGTAYVILKTVAPDGSYAYYADSAHDVPPYRQWNYNDMPVSQTYTWTITADQAGSYVSSITIIIDGDAPNGHLEDTKTATFTASNNPPPTTPPPPSYYYHVSVQEDEVPRGGTIHISVSTNYPNPSYISVTLKDSNGATRRTWSGDAVPSTYTIPSSGPDGIWTITPSGMIGVDTRGDSFTITGSGGGPQATTLHPLTA